MRSWRSRAPDVSVPAGDLFDKFQPLIDQREALLSTGITDPFNLVMEEVISPTVAVCNGRLVLNGL